MTPDSKAAMEKMLDYRSHFDRESRLCLELGWLAAAEFYELRIGALEAEITLHKQTIRMQTLDEGSPTQESPEARELVKLLQTTIGAIEEMECSIGIGNDYFKTRIRKAIAAYDAKKGRGS